MTELNFITNIVNSFNIGTSNVQVGLVAYSANTGSRFFLNTNQDKTSLINNINSLQYIPGGFGAVDFAGGLREARVNQFTVSRGKQLGVQDVLIILTNGESTVTNAAAVTELNLIRAAGIKVFAVGLTSTANQQIVSSLVVPPTPILNWNYFLNPVINQNLQLLASPVSTQVCVAVSSNCQNAVMDLIFAIPSTMSVFQAAGNNGGYFNNMLNFIADLVQQMSIGANTRVGLVIYGDNVGSLIQLNNNQQDPVSMANLIRSYQWTNLSFSHNLQNVFTFLTNQAFSSNNGARSNVNQVAVVITDAASSVNTLSTLAAAKAAFQAGIQVFTIGATQFVNVTELQLMASVPRLQYHEWWTIPGLDSSSLNAIQYNVEMELCRPNYDVQCRYTAFGGYQCFCQWGLCDTRPMNGTSCIDINECLTNNGGCAQSCSNTAGSFGCSCGTGFSISSDGRTCVDIDECQTATTCPVGLCLNTYGGYYCLNNNALVTSALHAESPSVITASLPGAIIGLSVGLVVMGTVLIAVVIGFIVYVRRNRKEKDEETDHLADSIDGIST